MTILITQKKRLNQMAFVMLILVFFVIGLGAYTRLSHSGLGCPDWPGCYGFLSVPDKTDELALANIRYPEQEVEYKKGAIEMIHRYIAGLALLGAFGLLAMTLVEKKKTGQSRYLFHAIAIVFIIVLQAAFGMWTVTLKLWPQIVTAHLLGGFTTLSLVYLLWLRTRSSFLVPDSFIVSIKHIRLIFVAFLIVLGQIFLGGWMAANYAAFACPDLPVCQGSIWPNADFAQAFNLIQHIGPTYLGGLLEGEARVAIHMSHRIGAIFTVLAVSLLGFYMLNKHKKLAYRLFFILGVQVMLGLANVWLQIPIWVAVAHNLIAALLLITMVEVLYLFLKMKITQKKEEGYDVI